MNIFDIEWWEWRQDAIYLTAVCAVVWAVVHEVAKAAIKKALGIPYK
ncbi:MAG: hypothetical protein ACK54F_03695 [Planctomycetia bacterium]|jgi:hypothetical protein